jgi:hypothetical protein
MISLNGLCVVGLTSSVTPTVAHVDSDPNTVRLSWTCIIGHEIDHWGLDTMIRTRI